MSEPGGSSEPTASTDDTGQPSRLGGTEQLTLPLWENGAMKLSNDQIFSESETNLILQHLFSNDYDTRQKAIAYLNINQHVITKPLVEILVKNITHNTLVFQVTYALEVIGKATVPVLLEALNQIKEIKTPLDETIMENICETLDRINDKSAAPILLKHLQDVREKIEILNKSIEHIAASEQTEKPTPETPARPADGSGGQVTNNGEAGNQEKHPVSEASLRKKLEFYQSVRIKIHTLLGEMNSPVGLDDLLALLGDGNKRIQGEVIETLGKIGNKNTLIPLIRMYPIEANISELGARYIKLTCREIVRREKISKSDQIFCNLTEPEKDTLDKILAGHRNGHKH